MYKATNRNFRYIIFIAAIFLIIAAVISGRSLILKLSYPVKYKEQVFRYSTQNNIDPYLVFAVIKAESSFNPNAVSRKNAKGLMQVTGETGQWGAKKLKMEQFDEDDLFDPDINVQIGCWYLGWLMKQFNNDIDLVIAAYNSGNGNVSKWLKNKEYSSSGNSLEKIPFKETDMYLKKVKNYYEVYKKLYAADSEA